MSYITEAVLGEKVLSCTSELSLITEGRSLIFWIQNVVTYRLNIVSFPFFLPQALLTAEL